MELKKFALASFAALSLVACGSGDDQSKPDEPKDKAPEKSAECVAAGDLCKLENGKWVIHKKDDNKPDDEVPAADVAFDYSQIGVTDKLEPEKKGFGFYHKGEKSPLDATWFENGVTLSPNIPWSSTKEYDVDLWNFVAIRLSDAKSVGKKNLVKYMFDEIGTKNQAKNPNKDFFAGGFGATGKEDNHDPAKFGNKGLSSIPFVDNKTELKYAWNVVPALVNTFMWRNSQGGLAYSYVDENNKLFHNQEEETVSDIGSGKRPLRVYGRNAFLETDKTKVVGHDFKNEGSETYELTNRPGVKYFRAVNYAWYDLNSFPKRKQKSESTVNAAVISVKTALSKYEKKTDGTRIPFPTDIKLGEMESVQFGRLTGQGVDPEADDIAKYRIKNLKEYKFTGGSAAAAGNPEAEDWYFARGTEATPVAVLEGYKKSGNKIAYDGQAVMFGLDYHPTTARKKMANGKKEEVSTNSIKPFVNNSDPKTKVLLDGKQNFVRMEWDPATGDIQGRVYGVWTAATYWRNLATDNTNGQVIVYKTWDPTNKNVATITLASNDIASNYNGTFMTKPIPAKDSATSLELIDMSDKTKLEANINKLVRSAFVLEPYAVTLVALKGKVVEGTNSFGGVAIRAKDESKGLFTGGFFGPKGHEIGGVINSQTGDMKDTKLTDPETVWGGAFGAKHNASAVQEDLIFQDAIADYMTSTEVFN